MPSQFVTSNTASKTRSFLFPILLFFFLIFSHGIVTADDGQTTSIGAIIDVDSRVGKEQKTALIIAVQNFNANSKSHKLAIEFRNTSGDPLRALSAAEELIKEKQAQVIIGMETWEATALVAEVGKRAQVPVLSFASAASTPPLKQNRWPFLVQMENSISEQIICTTAIVHSYNWRRVIVIYEDDTYGRDSRMLDLLSEELQIIGSEIEYHVVLPPFSSSSDPKRVVHEEVVKLLGKQSRVFVVLRSSLSMATYFFREAKEWGLMGRDSAWIITDTLSNLIDSVYPSVISSMQGALGIKTFYLEDSRKFLDFKAHFQQVFRLEYPEEDNSEPGIHALRAYDGITTIAQAVKKLGRNSTISSKRLLQRILSSNFTGLSGPIRFQGGELSSSPIFRIVNIVGKKYKELGFWSSKFRFSKNLYIDESVEKHSSVVDGTGGSMRVLESLVNWPGDLNRDPKGWAMPTDTKKMKIAVPGRTSFEKSVKVEWDESSEKNIPKGFCIDIFEEVLKILEKRYTLPYEFRFHNDTYDNLVEGVINETYDAVVGDVTILANRSKYVEFTQPFAESGLSMLVPVTAEAQKAWMFMKPFSKEMWFVTCAILFYTVFIVWVLEHQSNPEFRGPWKDQLGTALWFTFSSLFYAHREKIYSNYTKVVVVVWLFVVMILTSSYTANLTSMLTVPRLEPNVTSVNWLIKTNAAVACDGDSFVKDYLKNVLKIQNLKEVSSEHDYPKEFESNNISAAFLELPYERVFLNEYCNAYKATGPKYRFGGLGFVFRKGSPIAADFSEAILTLSENGVLKSLDQKWFGSSDCSNPERTSLSVESFWGIYLISGGTSTICFLIVLVRLVKNYRRNNKERGENPNPGDKSVWNKTVSLARYFHNGKIRSRGRSQGFASTPARNEWSSRSSSTKWELVSPSDASENFEGSPSPQIEIP